MTALQKKKRRIEIDLLRSLAIAAMILYHLLYDLQNFYDWSIGLSSASWFVFERGTAGLFLLLVGISFALSWQRSATAHDSWLQRYGKYGRRGLGLIAGGLIISLATYAFDSETFVRFGVLHLIGVGIILLPLFARVGTWNVLLGVTVLAAALALPGTTTATSLLLPLGIPPPGFTSVDYFPLLPWLGLVLIGYGLGNWFYVQTNRKTIEYERGGVVDYLAWPGRKALVIYFVHQPLLLIALRLMLEPIGT